MKKKSLNGLEFLSQKLVDRGTLKPEAVSTFIRLCLQRRVTLLGDLIVVDKLVRAAHAIIDGKNKDNE